MMLGFFIFISPYFAESFNKLLVKAFKAKNNTTAIHKLFSVPLLINSEHTDKLYKNLARLLNKNIEELQSIKPVDENISDIENNCKSIVNFEGESNMNLNRRKFLQDASLLTVALLFNQHVCAGSKNLKKACSLRGGLQANGIELLRTSGNSDLDRSINLELTHIAESFNILPGFGFYDDSDGLNAFALDETLIPHTKGTVIFGQQLLTEELASRDWGGLAIAGIIAHEFGHIYQYQSQFFDLLTQGQDTDRLLELHADYLAGYYLGLKRLRSGEIDIKAFLDSLYLKGDTDFNSPDHHGTPTEREQVMLEGYKMGLTNNSNVPQVAKMGMILVKNI